MNKPIFIIILVIFFAIPSYAGENQDKRKAKREARSQELREREQQSIQDQNRDFRAEDELYKEIQAQERLLSQLRRKLYTMRENNLRKYGSEERSSQERSGHSHQIR